MFEDDSRDSFADPDLDSARKPAVRPASIPAKFWDQAKGELRTEALLQAYLELERRVSARGGIDMPDSAETYAISARHPAVTSDPEINKRLYEAGFTQQQAQLVYDLAFERLVPLLVAAGAEAGPDSGAGTDSAAPDPRDGDISHLCDHFGGEARWRQIAPQLAAWGRKSLPPEAFEALASSVEGVKILHRLMSSGEPSLGRAPAPRDEAQSEDQLKKMIQDPRYWKNRDPAFIAKVSDGFRRLYGEA
jgi:hypothetical protein